MQGLFWKKMDEGSVQVFSVGLYHLLIPEEGFFSGPLHGPLSLIVQIHIYEAVALAHFSRGSGNKIDGSPGGIAHQIHTVQGDGVPHGLYMALQVIDPVIIVDRAVLLHSVIGAKAVLYDKEGKAVAVIEVIQGKTKAQRVHGPAQSDAFR